MNSSNRKALYNQQILKIEEELTPFGIFNDLEDPEFEVADGDVWLSDKFQNDYQEFLKSINIK
jgi:hypothetical protein